MKNFMNSQDEFRLNEILFENRNKKYGAYALRIEESNMLKKSLFIGVAFFGLVAITPMIISSLQVNEIGGILPQDPVFTPINIPIDVPPVVVVPVITYSQPVNTVSLELPTPTKNAIKETPPAAISSIAQANIGTETVVGTPPISVILPPISNNIIVPEVKKPPVNDKAIVKKVDIEANFAGGINTFRSKVVQNFNAGDFEGTGNLIKTTITFIVEKDGTISGVKANGPNAAFNQEAEKTIKNIKGRWNPAKLQGENVRSYFNFPISMQFE